MYMEDLRKIKEENFEGEITTPPFIYPVHLMTMTP